MIKVTARSIYVARIDALYLAILGSLQVEAFSGQPELWRVVQSVSNAKACSDRRDIVGVRIHLARAHAAYHMCRNVRAFTFASIA